MKSVTPLQIRKDLFKENQKKEMDLQFPFFRSRIPLKVRILKVKGVGGVLNEKKNVESVSVHVQLWI